MTAVGGTSLAVGKGDTYLWETGWGTEKAVLSGDGKSWVDFPGAFNSGAGGGTSRTVAQPYGQKGVVPDAPAKAYDSAGNRVVPDIAAIARVDCVNGYAATGARPRPYGPSARTAHCKP